MRWVIAAVIVMLAAPAWAEEVLYCTETKKTGFLWDKGSIEGKRTNFKPDRYIVKIISETERVITPSTGDITGDSLKYTCRRPWLTLRLRKQIVCDDEDGLGYQPWIFYDNTFMRALLTGLPTGGGDPNATISYGTCVKY